MNWQTLFLVAIGFAVMTTSSVAANKSDTETVSNQLPVKIYDRYLIVAEGSIGSLHGLRFLLDTGTSTTTVDRQVAKRVGLAGHRTQLVNFDKLVTVERTEVPELGLGPQQAFNVTVMIEDLRYLRAGDSA
ncbi:MAG: retropepsin-like aspartic protease, partial [Candidatus Acidiferrum sp.]